MPHAAPADLYAAHLDTLQARAAEARAKGANRVHWLTGEDNAQARVLYDRLSERSGFIQYRIML